MLLCCRSIIRSRSTDGSWSMISHLGPGKTYRPKLKTTTYGTQPSPTALNIRVQSALPSRSAAGKQYMRFACYVTFLRHSPNQSTLRCREGDNKLESKKKTKVLGVACDGVKAATSPTGIKASCLLAHRTYAQTGAGRARDGHGRGRADCRKRDQPHRRGRAKTDGYRRLPPRTVGLARPGTSYEQIGYRRRRIDSLTDRSLY